MSLLRMIPALLLAALPGIAAARDLAIPDVTYPRLPAEAASAAGFAPPGWRAEAEATGDLNGDGAADLALVLHAQDPANIVANPGMGSRSIDTNPRILAVAFGRAEGGYALALQDEALIPRHIDPTLADPFDARGDLAIRRGTLRVTMHRFANIGSWYTENRTFTFRWQDGRFALIGYDSMALHRGSGETEEVSINYLTHRMKISAGSIESDASRVRWRSLPARPLRSLGDVGDGLAFSSGR